MKPVKKIVIFVVCVALIGLGIYNMKQSYESLPQPAISIDTLPPITGEDASETSTPPYTFVYDSAIVAKDYTHTGAWRINAQTEGTVHTGIQIPETFQPKTNFRDATFTVGSSRHPQAISECLIATNGERARNVITINNTLFQMFTLADAAMSNYYDSKSYRAIHNGECFAVEYTIHSLSMGIFTPEQNIGEFNTALVVAELEKIVQSFKFVQ